MHNTWIEVDDSVLHANIRAVQAVLRPSTTLIFVVKANAYGHGMVPTAQAAAAAGVRWFGVAHPHEAYALRAALPDVDILVMGASAPDEAAALASQRITPIVVNAEHGAALAATAHAHGSNLNAHLKIDTGMGRLGVSARDALNAYDTLRTCNSLTITGLCSHFATVEPKQPQRAEQQAAEFIHIAHTLEQQHGARLMKHISSSRAMLYHPDWDLDAVRPGICLYGYGASDPAMRAATRPFLQWKCRVMQVKEVPANAPIGYYGTYTTPKPTRIAVLSAGYADGYHRALSNRGHVLIGGRRCPVIGRVSMNWITVDCGMGATVRPGDEAVLIGEQQGVSVWAGELARICRTIPYEMLVGIRSTERRVINGASTNQP